MGVQGSSYQLVARLVRRLPVMACPTWTQSRMQPIGLPDLVQAIGRSAEDDYAESHLRRGIGRDDELRPAAQGDRSDARA